MSKKRLSWFRVHHWINIETLKPMFGVQAFHGGKWLFAAESGRAILFETEEEAKAKVEHLERARAERIKIGRRRKEGPRDRRGRLIVKRSPSTDLSFERAHELLRYEPETGVFYWRVDRGHKAKAGDIAGRIGHYGYLLMAVDGCHVRGHRLAWFMQTGGWPAEQIDHINGDKGDNRWSNLRLATNSQNQMNIRGRSTNRSGYKGVVKNGHRWLAQITANGKIHRLGTFGTPEEAAEAYRQAAERMHGEFARVA